MTTRTQLSVSLGARAFPTVKEAIQHVTEHPEHDPFIVCTLVEGDAAPEQKIVWQCHECGPAAFPKEPTCSLCHRERTLGQSEHPMDTYDYNPIQAITGKPLGWYSGDDGEVCPECMTKTLRNQ